MNARPPLAALLAVAALSASSLTSCASIERHAVRSMADMFTSPGGASAFTGDDDPQLIADALPLALKFQEILLQKDPGNADLAAATGKNFVMYSGAFVQMPAERLPDEEWQAYSDAEKRAKKLFRRGRDYCLSALEIRHGGFRDALESGDYDGAAGMLETSDAEAVRWAALGWLGMASVDPLDIEVASGLDKAVLLLYEGLLLDDQDASVHDTLVQVLLSLPSSMVLNAMDRGPETGAAVEAYYKNAGVGADARSRALYHYGQAVALSGGDSPSPYITLAVTMAVADQDLDQYKDLLNKALAVDPGADPDNRLMVIVYQERAAWLLEHSEDYFL